MSGAATRSNTRSPWGRFRFWPPGWKRNRKPPLTGDPRTDAEGEGKKQAIAGKDLRRAVAEAASAMESRNWRDAADRWRAIIDESGDEAPARAYAGLCRAARRTGDLRMAGEVAEAGLARYPDNPAILTQAAEAAEAVRDWPAATALWQRVIERPVRSCAPFVRLAQLLAATGDFRGAEIVVIKALDQCGEIPQLVDLRADICFSMGRWREALALFEEKLADPATGEARRNIAKVDASIARRLLDIENVVKSANEHRASKGRRKIAVYSACIGGYDALTPPEIFNDRFDYFIFVDEVVMDLGGYCARPATFTHKDATRTARFVKTHPHLLLGDYDIAIWVDANIVLLDDLNDAVEEFIRSGRPVAGAPHQHRSSVTEEFEACVERAKDDPDVIERQRVAYRSIGFDCSDLIETPWMMFNLRDSRVAGFLDAWWAEIEKFSRRDQLSVNYALGLSGLEWHPLLQPPHAARDNPYVASVPHGGSPKVARLAEAMGATIFDPFAGPSYAASRDRRIAAITMPIDVVVCVHNALDDVRLCVESIARHRRHENVRLVLVDDGSGDATRDYVSNFAAGRNWVHLVRNDAAVGYSRAADQGVAESDAAFVIVLNSDTIVTDGWAEKLADALLSTRGAGIVGPLSNAAGMQSIPGTKGSGAQTAVNMLPAGVSPDDMNRHCEQWTVEGILPRVSLVHGFCLGIHRAVLDRIGFFDVEKFPRGYGEEDDFCLRAGQAGFGLVIATHTFVYHAKSKSFRAEERVRLMRQGSATLRRLHGVDRLKNAIDASTENRILQRIRQNAYTLYRTPWPAGEQSPQ